ncbi:MAG: alpha/beta hydrolase [Gaiellaceae bacterium]
MTSMLVAACLLTAAACGGADRPDHSSSYTLHSRLLDRDLDQAVVRSGQRRPLLVILHGRGNHSPDWLFGPELDKTLAALGSEAPDLLFPWGGEASYSHDRRDGPWGRYVVEEAIPAAVERLGADPRRIAIDGFSMGGFGALDIARLHPGRFCAAGGHAAALWRRGGETPAGAFDDAEDFVRHDVIGAARRGWPFGRTKIWLDVGRDDPFRDADTALAAALGPRAHFTVWPGRHEGAHVRRHLRRTLGFYANALAR